MPLVKGHSNKAVNANIKELVRTGHPQTQAVAIALHVANGGKHESKNSAKTK
jgi:hypothetical protein